MLSVGVSKRVEFTVNVNKTNVDKLFDGAIIFTLVCGGGNLCHVGTGGPGAAGDGGHL